MARVNAACGVCGTATGSSTRDQLGEQGWIRQENDSFTGFDWICADCQAVSADLACMASDDLAEREAAERERITYETFGDFLSLVGEMRKRRWLSEADHAGLIAAVRVVDVKIRRGFRLGDSAQDMNAPVEANEPGQQ